MEEDPVQFLAQLPTKCAAIVNTLGKDNQKISALRQELSRVYDEHTATKGLVDILLSLIEKMWLLLCTYDQEHGAAVRQRQIFESVLDAAIAQLDLQSLRQDYGSLSQENHWLRSSLERQSAELQGEKTSTRAANSSPNV
ncbi:hypothetical protein BDV12DRAFT_203356 [Aspergillus spectabilis]